MISDFNIDIFFCNTVFLMELLIAREKKVNREMFIILSTEDNVFILFFYVVSCV